MCIKGRLFKKRLFTYSTFSLTGFSFGSPAVAGGRGGGPYNQSAKFNQSEVTERLTREL